MVRVAGPGLTCVLVAPSLWMRALASNRTQTVDSTLPVGRGARGTSEGSRPHVELWNSCSASSFLLGPSHTGRDRLETHCLTPSSCTSEPAFSQAASSCHLFHQTSPLSLYSL